MSDWSNLDSNLLDLILQRLEYTDAVRSKAVCHRWHEVADVHIRSRRSEMAGLVIPGELDEEEHGRSFQFYDLKDKKHVKIKDIPDEIYSGACFGSSHGWLVFVESGLNLCLFDPFSKARKQISSVDCFPRVYAENYEVRWHVSTLAQMWALGLVVPNEGNQAKRFRMFRMNKAALSSNPLHMLKQDDTRLGLMVTHSVDCSHYGMSQLAYYNFADGKWHQLGFHSRWGGIEYEKMSINDIICYNEQFYVLIRDNKIQVWDFEDSSLALKKEIHIGLWDKVYETNRRLGCVSRSYIVESMGELLIVTRFVEQRRSVLFHVYKLDCEGETVKHIDSLPGQVVFVGGNHSQSFPIQSMPWCEENSIYFTDDCGNGGWSFPTQKHDVGIYNLTKGTVSHWPHLESQFYKEPAFWFFPI